MRRLPKIGVWAALVLFYAWPALLNGGPFIFPDTSHYIRAADAAVLSVTGHRSIWSDRLLKTAPTGAPGPSATGEPSSPSRDVVEGGRTEKQAGKVRPARTVLTGRSIYYGAFLYAGLEGLGRYGPVFLQSAIAVATVALFLWGATGTLTPRSRRRWFWFGMLGGLVTPLPFFVSRLMPEAFTGPMILAFLALILFRSQYSRLERAFLLLVAAASITFHISHILLILSVGGGALLLNLGRRNGWGIRFLLPTGLILFAAAAQMLFSAGVTRALGAPPTAPPFLSARLIADGPGYRYLKKHCVQREFLLCDYRDRMPQPSDTMLWSDNSRDGIFSTLDEDEKRQLGREDIRFYLAVMREYPADVLGSILWSTGEQALAFKLDHFNYIPEHREGARAHLPPEAFAWVEQSGAYRGTIPIKPTLMVTTAMTIVSLFLLAAVSLSRRGRAVWRTPGASAALLILLAVIANVVICGGMSTPHGRYLMRIIWLLPLGVIAWAAAIAGPRSGWRGHQRGETPVTEPSS